MQSPLLGKVIAQRYRLISQLGAGAMSTVFLARHVVIERLCAIKVLRPDGGSAPAMRERFLREARAVNRIHHPNIVEITDFGEADDLVYLVMEYVPGEPLSRALAKGPLPWRAAARVGVQIASALERAHEMGVIHRDLKPSNVLVLPKKDGSLVVKLTDFGVAKIADEPRLTETSGLVGTPGYMAPEYQLFGRMGPRADLYSLGVMLFEATTGRLPIPPSPAGGDASARLLAPPPSIRDLSPDVEPFFDDVTRTLLAPDPDDRPRDAFEACDLLERALATTPRSTSLVPASRPAPVSARSERPSELADPPTEITTRRPGPRLTTAPAHRLLPICLTALSRIEAAAGPSPRPEIAALVARAEKQVGIVGRIARLVESDTQDENALRAEARSIHADLGKRLDDAGRERSKTLGWAGTAAERGYEVQERLSLGEDPIPAMDAMVWERAALAAAEAEAHARAEELAAEMTRIQADLDRATERIEAEIATVTARLWGRVGALRASALEAWMDLESAAQAASVPIDSLCD
ncbi:MAG: serine/threonine-protein kinase [Polyangiaceae bacterium]